MTQLDNFTVIRILSPGELRAEGKRPETIVGGGSAHQVHRPFQQL